MISVIVPTLNAASTLPDTLRALVPAAMGTFVREVVVADGGSTDDTLAIADAAGCEIVKSERGGAQQLIASAKAARGQWLMFLDAGVQLGASWEDEARRFLNANADADRAAAFRIAEAKSDASGQFWTRLRQALANQKRAGQGLLISRRFYDALGGYRDVADPHADLLRRIGGGRLTLLRA